MEPRIANITFEGQQISANLKVFVVWHRTYEEVLSVHFTEAGAQEYIEKASRPEDYDRFEYDEFEVEL
jgi:hypothetical protein